MTILDFGSVYDLPFRQQKRASKALGFKRIGGRGG